MLSELKLHRIGPLSSYCPTPGLARAPDPDSSKPASPQLARLPLPLPFARLPRPRARDRLPYDGLVLVVVHMLLLVVSKLLVPIDLDRGR